MRAAAIYARVSSDRQKEEHTIASQTAALMAFAREQDCDVPVEWVFEDEGYSGASLVRPGLERVRDLAAEGRIEAVLVHAPDRLSRRYAHQILLIEEFARVGVETLFVRSPRATTPEDQLLLQFQGMIAEYERAQILVPSTDIISTLAARYLRHDLGREDALSWGRKLRRLRPKGASDSQVDTHGQ